MRFRVRTAVLAALAAVAGACGSDSSVAPELRSTTLDAALSELSLPALTATAGSFDAVAAATPAFVPSRCAYVAASQSFACTPITTAGLTITQGYTLLDGSGGKQAAFDAATTAAVRANTTVAGTVTQGGTVLTVDSQQELTLSGLLTATHTLNGVSTTHLAGNVATGGTSLPLTSTLKTTITNLVLPAGKGDANKWPTSGTIVVESVTALGPVAPATTRVSMTFNGTSVVTVAVTGPGVSTTCQVDLANKAPSCG